MTAGDVGADTSSLLGDHVSWQLRRLCAAVGLDDARARYTALIRELIGPAAAWPLGVTPAWRSQVADDHTPVEYSMSFDVGRTPRLRVLVEPSGRRPDLWTNMQAGLRVLELLADRHQFCLDRLRMLQDLFFPPRPQGSFGLWLAAELGRNGTPEFKVYLNPSVHGPDQAWQVVGEALARLGFGNGAPSLLRYGVPRDRQLDRSYIFSLDLGNPWGRPRVKVYVRHEGFSAAEAAQAACAVPGVSPESIAQFCELIGGPGPFTGRPLISCFSFVEGDDERPSGHVLHVPIRDYVEHDREARDRAAAALDRYGFDGGVLGRALAGVTRRPLTDGVGLVSYVALVSNPRPRRMTVYISSEAYEVAPPRSLPVPLRAVAVSGRRVVRKQTVVRGGQRPGVAPVTTMEPYRIKVVEPIPLMTRKEREAPPSGANPNLFDLRAGQLTIDLLSDCGTGGLSAAQLAAAMAADESDAGARPLHRFRVAIEELTAYEDGLPVHQSRAAERILLTALLEPGQITLSSTHVDATRARVELAGGQAHDIPCCEAHGLESLAPFKGDVDLEALEQILDGPEWDRVALVIVTIANSGDRQPVSTGNLAAVSRICRERRAAGVAVVEPPGIHAICLTAGHLLPPHQLPGHALAGELGLEGGIRSASLGSLHLGAGRWRRRTAGRRALRAGPAGDPVPGVHADPHRVRGPVLARIAENAERIPGYRIVESPAVLRHLQAKLGPVPIPRPGSWTGN